MLVARGQVDVSAKTSSIKIDTTTNNRNRTSRWRGASYKKAREQMSSAPFDCESRDTDHPMVNRPGEAAVELVTIEAMRSECELLAMDCFVGIESDCVGC